jgi:hypothetical protein
MAFPLGQKTGLSLNAYRLFPALTVGPTPFVPSQPAKDWSMPAGYVDPNPVFAGFTAFDVVVMVNGAPSWGKQLFKNSDATACNVEPAGYNWPVLAPTVTPPLPCAIPIDKTKLPAGYTLGTDFMGEVLLVPNVTDATVVPFTEGDHDAIAANNALLTAIAAKLNGTV